jgi:hypothetical protein
MQAQSDSVNEGSFTRAILSSEQNDRAVKPIARFWRQIQDLFTLVNAKVQQLELMNNHAFLVA